MAGRCRVAVGFLGPFQPPDLAQVPFPSRGEVWAPYPWSPSAQFQVPLDRSPTPVLPFSRMALKTQENSLCIRLSVCYNGIPLRNGHKEEMLRKGVWEGAQSFRTLYKQATLLGLPPLYHPEVPGTHPFGFLRRLLYIGITD